ncbi:hypothetical protein [Secundilactobacillus kimchicus]|uniref:hypothetical protein n=1 Tax=Secundilactobacillus kimchicus TaxID=528209 RepID=UPI0024363178|nr:hypothetical protein [Secundilactobacillus kimchicus]
MAWKRAFSVDGLIKQPIPDIERMSRVLAQTKAQFTQARAAGKKNSVYDAFCAIQPLCPFQ